MEDYSFIFVIVAILIITLFAYSYQRNKKARDFVQKHSVSLKRLLEINEKYKNQFKSCNNFDISHTYDNYNYYSVISCEDFLIYNLQFTKKSVIEEIIKASDNWNVFQLYSDEVKTIKTLGIFDEEYRKLNEKYLLSLEEKMFNQSKLKPTTDFQIMVTLFYAKMDGRICDSKCEPFNSNEIMSIIDRLSNKNGDFYRDRDIWDSLCRVERGKVSNKIRFSIYERDGYRCQICGRSGRFDDLEIDHIKPIAKGGKSTYDNLQTLCSRCNKEKSDKY